MRKLALIAAVGSNGVIGVDGDLPWRISEDLKHFRRNTLGHAVVMGRKTWDSLPGALKKRRNLVITRQVGLQLDGAEVFHSLEDALESAWSTDPEPRVIGGATLYAAAMPIATKLLLTEVDQSPAGDTFFPEFDRGGFSETSRDPHEGYAFVTLER